ncbi:hypothetical protein ACWG0P_13935 [Amedibacillus sp. YH-ame6]
MNSKLEEITRLFNLMFPSYVMTYECRCDPFMDVIDISINNYYHISIAGERVLSMSLEKTLMDIVHMFVGLKVKEIRG